MVVTSYNRDSGLLQINLLTSAHGPERVNVVLLKLSKQSYLLDITKSAQTSQRRLCFKTTIFLSENDTFLKFTNTIKIKSTNFLVLIQSNQKRK